MNPLVARADGGPHLPPAVAAIRDGLVVSCQAPPGHPLQDSEVIGRVALCAAMGGAAGLRVNGPSDVSSVRQRTDLPIVGLHKVRSGHRDLITPGLEYVAAICQAGADIIAVEFTSDAPGNPAALVSAVRREFARPVMADVSSLDEGRSAWHAGADLVSTTLSGYTSTQLTTPADGPDLRLVEQLATAGVRVVGEGRYRTQAHVRRAFDAGAWSVVVGAAITNPVDITRRLVSSTPAGPLQPVPES